MVHSKRGYVLMFSGITFSKSMCPKTQDGEDKHEFDLISFGYMINHVRYVMY